MTSRWHAVLCKPRREALAEANLRNQGLEVYLPRMVGLRRRSGRWEQRIEPLFPRYLFLNEGDGGRGLASVRSTLGVFGPGALGGRAGAGSSGRRGSAARFSGPGDRMPPV